MILVAKVTSKTGADHAAPKKVKVLSCDKHDYLEIICMFHYLVKVTEKTGTVIEGKAVDVQITDEKQEALLIQSLDDETLIATDNIATIDVLTPGARFKQIVF